MQKLTLTVACGAYDRTAALADGRVRPEGIEPNLLLLEPEECFFRMIRHAEFDVAELSLSSYAIALARGDRRFVGLPVFLSRAFRHNCLFVRADSPVERPEELRGGSVGVPEYQMTAAVWVRAFLHHDHGLEPTAVTWRTGGLEQRGRPERQPIELPPRFRVEPLPPDRTLVEALVDGELDALIAPRVPGLFRTPDPPLRRLFPDYAERERASYLKTGIFPIMHLVVVRSQVYERHPWVAASLLKAFTAARDLAMHDAADAPALRYSIPFVLPVLEAQQQLFNGDPWSYGLAPNRDTLEQFLRFMGEQGLLQRELAPEELFAPPTLETSKI